MRLNVALFDQLTRQRGARTRDEQARIIGIPVTTLYRLRAGDSDTSLARAMQVAGLLGVRLDELWTTGPDQKAA